MSNKWYSTSAADNSPATMMWTPEHSQDTSASGNNSPLLTCWQTLPCIPLHYPSLMPQLFRFNWQNYTNQSEPRTCLVSRQWQWSSFVFQCVWAVSGERLTCHKHICHSPEEINYQHHLSWLMVFLESFPSIVCPLTTVTESWNTTSIPRAMFLKSPSVSDDHFPKICLLPLV